MTVRQIDNTLALLEYFAERQRPATLAEITRHFDWPRSSAHNILTTLVQAGYLYEPRARGGYYPSHLWQRLADAFARAEPLPEALHRILRRLSEDTGETVWVSAPAGQFAVVLDVIESPAAVRYVAQPGMRVPIHNTATGQALLWQMPDQDRDVLLRRARYDGWGPASPQSPSAVQALLADGAARGWFHSARSHSPDLGGVAVPVTLAERGFSITVAGPVFRVEDKAQAHARAIHATIAAELGAKAADLRLPD